MIRFSLAHRMSGKLATLVLLFGLGGCSLFGEPNEVLVNCPTTGVLAAGERLERYSASGARDLTDLILQAKIGGIRTTCSILKEERILEMDLLLEVAAERGPAAPQGQQMPIQYFVVIADKNDNIQSRKVFNLAATFDGTARQAVFNEELFLSINIPADKGVADYRVIVSLQLTQAELQRALNDQK